MLQHRALLVAAGAALGVGRPVAGDAQGSVTAGVIPLQVSAHSKRFKARTMGWSTAKQCAVLAFQT